VRCRPADKAVEPLLSDEHFWVDGTLIEAWASMKSLQPKAEASGAEPPAGEAGSGGTGQKPPAKAATPRWTSMARSARTKPIGPLPILFVELARDNASICLPERSSPE